MHLTSSCVQQVLARGRRAAWLHGIEVKALQHVPVHHW